MKRQKRKYSQYRGRRTVGKGFVLPLAAVLILGLAAVCWFLIPGMKFSAELLACIAAAVFLATALNHWAQKNAAGAAVRRVFWICLAVFAVVFAAVEGIVIHAGRGSSAVQPPDAVIVLGAGVNGEKPSPILKSRIDAAADYLRANPTVPAVLSGGKGSGENISEAQAMENALTARGISSDRLYLEERSTTTAENFQYSEKLLKDRGISPAEKKVAVITSDFHLCRAEYLAKKTGMQTEGVAAKTPHWWLSMNYYAREVFALGDTVLLQRI